MRISSFLLLSVIFFISAFTYWKKNRLTDISGKTITVDTPFNSRESGECLLRSQPLKECHNAHKDKSTHKDLYTCLITKANDLSLKFADRRCAEHYAEFYKPIEEINKNPNSLPTSKAQEINTKIIKDKELIKCIKSSAPLLQCTKNAENGGIEIQKDCFEKVLKDMTVPAKEKDCVIQNFIRINEAEIYDDLTLLNSQ